MGILLSLCPTGITLMILSICFCCIRRCFRKRRTKDGKKGLKGAVDLKSVQLLGNAYKEKVKSYTHFSFPSISLLLNFIFIHNLLFNFWHVQYQVQPDMEELTENVEEVAEEGEKDVVQKLGKLQYKVSLYKFDNLSSFYYYFQNFLLTL